MNQTLFLYIMLLMKSCSLSRGDWGTIVKSVCFDFFTQKPFELFKA